MSEPAATYHAEQSSIGYMPLPEVYAALDFVLAAARAELPAAEPQAVAGGRAFLLPWLRAEALPSQAQLGQLAAIMAEQVGTLTEAFRSTLQRFVDDLDEHPCPLPGTPFGDYYPDLVQLLAAADGGAVTNPG